MPVRYPTAESARTNTPSTYQSVNQSIIGANIYDPKNPAIQPYLAFINATDTSAKAIAWQNLYRGLYSSTDMVPAGSAYKNNFEYLQSILRGLKLSSGKTAIGVADPAGQDQKALSNVLQAAIGQNLSIPDYLNLLITGGVGAGKTVKQVDTTTKYNKQISTALQLLDLTDAQSYFADSYFKAYGQNPSTDLIDKFKTSWNLQAKKQQATTTYDTVTTYEKVYDKKKPIIDPKTKKPKLDAKGNPMYQQAVDANGVLQWKPITKGVTTTTGQGFTQKEQDQFLSEFLVSNFPDAKFDIKSLGGAARSLYEQFSTLHKNNYSDIPDFTSIAPSIKAMLSTTDAAVSKTVYDEYAKKIRDNVATKFMSLADWVNAGNDASEKIIPMIDAVSKFLESDVTVNDNLMKRILNFQGTDGKYRLPNDYELNQLLVNDPRYGRTSTAINESINTAQSLASKLRLG